MKTQIKSLNPFKIIWTAYKTDGRKITKACAKDLKKVDYFINAWAKTQISVHDYDSRAKNVLEVLVNHGYKVETISITDKQYGMINSRQELFESFLTVATTKQKAAAKTMNA